MNPWLGTTIPKLGNLDEVRLFHAMKKIWNTEPNLWGPYVLLGHTHVPLARPSEPNHSGYWARYYNGGCGIFYRMITGIEWDGTDSAENPKVDLVAWRYNSDVVEGGEGLTKKVLTKPLGV